MTTKEEMETQISGNMWIYYKAKKKAEALGPPLQCPNCCPSNVLTGFVNTVYPLGFNRRSRPLGYFMGPLGSTCYRICRSWEAVTIRLCSSVGCWNLRVQWRRKDGYEVGKQYHSGTPDCALSPGWTETQDIACCLSLMVWVFCKTWGPLSQS